MADRFQFFVWTIVGCLGFVAMLFVADPALMASLPKIPDNFFNLMGISALAYLGGKALRSAGPVVRSAVIAKNAANDYVITVDGQNMEKESKLKLDGADLTPKARANVSQGDNANPTWSTQLIITIDGASNEAKALANGTQSHTIEIINGDGQAGSAAFIANPPKITSIKDPAGNDPTHNGQQQTLTVNGDNFVSGMTAEWLAPGATAPVAINKVDVTDTKKFTIDVTAPSLGLGTLTLIPPLGPRVTGKVTVQ